LSLSICVYSSSSERLDAIYYEAARELGRLMGERGHALVFGAGNIGLMNAMALDVQKAGGAVVGVIPRALRENGWCLETSDEIIETDGMRDRKAIMEERADAFIAMPGGFGTLEELLEIITLKQLRYHEKGIVVLDTGGYYDPLLMQFERMFDQGFSKRKFKELYHVTADPAEALDHLEAYTPNGAGFPDVV
jgi:cytokinin riboside 5'-monophosphate phosphoribohydrolase